MKKTPSKKTATAKPVGRRRRIKRAGLLPCPFCASTKVELQGEIDDRELKDGQEGGWMHAFCLTCTAVGPAAATQLYTAKPTGWLENRAALKWNSRPTADEPPNNPFCQDRTIYDN